MVSIDEWILMKYLVVLPTYKEFENLQILIPQLMALDSCLHVLIVDDNSNDGTENFVYSQKVNYGERLNLIVRTVDQSYAKSLLVGLKLGHKEKFDFVIQMDSDGSHSPRDIPKLISCEGDLIIGSRYFKNSTVLNVPVFRQLYSILGNIYISILWQTSIRDKTNGFRLFRKKSLELISNLNVVNEGFAVQIEVLNTLRRSKKIEIKEVPIEFVFREVGTSKFDFKKLIEALKFVSISIVKGRHG
jgi:dolichol-phosphate mannosyltransferase